MRWCAQRSKSLARVRIEGIDSKALHRTPIPLSYIAAGGLGRYRFLLHLCRGTELNIAAIKCNCLNLFDIKAVSQQTFLF